jgi:hypothetical protein
MKISNQEIVTGETVAYGGVQTEIRSVNNNSNTSTDCPPAKQDNIYGSQTYAIKWTILIIVSLAAVFLARLIDTPINPFGIYYPPIALLIGIVTVLLLMYGVYVLLSTKARTSTMVKRKAIMLIIQSIFMLAGFFMFKQIIPLMFF